MVDLSAKGGNVRCGLIGTEEGDLVAEEMNPETAFLEEFMMTYCERDSRLKLIYCLFRLTLLEERLTQDSANTTSLGNRQTSLLYKLSGFREGRIGTLCS